jgi:hypothetical protein
VLADAEIVTLIDEFVQARRGSVSL